MTSSTKYFMSISHQINCPLYQSGEQLILSDRSLHLPAGKSACLILVRDLTELLFLLKENPPTDTNEHLFSCSGCQGIIKFKQIKPHEVHVEQKEIGFSGYLEALPPEELMQTINMNQKSGLLILSYSSMQASVSFKNGNVVSACHGDNKDVEAFFRILAEKNGFFQFSQNQTSLEEVNNTPIGDFMNLLMEGLQKIDEDENKNGG